MDLISTLPIGSLGAGGILTVVVLLILRGALIPRSIHEDRIRDKDAELAYYRTALDRECQRGDIMTAQVETLMEVASTTEHVLTSLSEAAKTSGGRS